MEAAGDGDGEAEDTCRWEYTKDKEGPKDRRRGFTGDAPSETSIPLCVLFVFQAWRLFE